jgi:hypothetical protein
MDDRIYPDVTRVYSFKEALCGLIWVGKTYLLAWQDRSLGNEIRLNSSELNWIVKNRDE